jgi:hypothetical protein
MNRLITTINKFCLRAERELPPEDWGFKKHWTVLILSMIAAAYAALALGQDCTWDVMNYHFYSGYAFLAKPLNYDLAPAQIQSFFNPLMHVLSYLLLAHLPSIIVAIFLGSIQGLNFYLMFQISQILFRNWSNPFRFMICIFSAATGCYGSVFVLELGTTFGDSLISLFILSALLLIFRYLASAVEGKRSRDVLLGLAGAILGVALGLKFTVAIYVVAMAITLSAMILLSRRRLRPLFLFFGFMGFGFAAVYGFWGYNLYREYQSPVFPYLNGIFHSPFYENKNFADPRFFPRSWQQRYFYPFFFAQKNNLVSEIPFRDMRFALDYIAVVVTAVAGLVSFIAGGIRSENRLVTWTKVGPRLFLLMLMSFFSISYILWQNQFSIYRYLILLELLTPAFLALVLTYFIKKKLWVFLGSLLLNILICLVVIPANFGRQKFDDALLKAEIPRLADLDKSVVIMGGIEATSFIIPHFPAETRFIRISSSLCNPGENARFDDKIRQILARYGAAHTLAFVSTGQDKVSMRKHLSYYGLKVDKPTCQPVLNRKREVGYLCKILADSSPAAEIQEQKSFP